MLVTLLCWIAALPVGLWAAEAEVLRPRVPPQHLESAKRLLNPFSGTPTLIEKGRALYFGKAFCVACHGQDGKGFASDLQLKGPLPRDFTDRNWQAARADGELFWVLNNGSPGTDMAAFVPLVLTEEEAWQVVIYIRSLGAR